VEVRAAVCNRVDLAGGTLDIYPLYLLVPGAVTVNAAILVRSEARIRAAGVGGARLVSEDLGARLAGADTASFPAGGPLGLVATLLRFLPPLRGVELRVRNEAPLGSGLGGSSALLVAVLQAVACLTGRRRGWEEAARLAMEVEAAYLGTPTGRQDHAAALRGGILAIRFPPGRMEAERIPARSPAGRALEAHGVLAYTGVAHRSGAVNWRMIRRAVEGDKGTLAKFRGIAAAARDVWEALGAQDVPAAGRAMAREWAVRRTLAPGVLPRRLGGVLDAPFLRARTAGLKLCGAGGGGSLFALLRDPADRPPVEAFLAQSGFRILPFRLGGPPVVERRVHGG